MKKRNTNKKKGFTLIELVVVIAIIGILAAVITPRVRLAIFKARDAKAVATLDGLRTATNVYFAETGNKLSSVSGTTVFNREHMNALKTAGYLDGKGNLVFAATGNTETPLASTATLANTDEVLLEVGTKTTAACDTSSTGPKGYFKIKVDTDGVGLSLVNADKNEPGDGLEDTNCQPWNQK